MNVSYKINQFSYRFPTKVQGKVSRQTLTCTFLRLSLSAVIYRLTFRPDYTTFFGKVHQTTSELAGINLTHLGHLCRADVDVFSYSQQNPISQILASMMIRYFHSVFIAWAKILRHIVCLLEISKPLLTRTTFNSFVIFIKKDRMTFIVADT